MLRRLGYPENIARAFDEVPREEFVEADSIWRVYTDNAVVSYKSESTYSTSSQPSLMAEFIRSVGLEEGMRVLEIGGGTGYNAAVMGKIVGSSGKVVSVEYVEEIYERAVENIQKLGISNVVMVKGDGYYGYEKYSPYDAIIVTVGVDEVPVHWIRQLKRGGKMIVPMNLLSVSLAQPAILFEKRKEIIWGEHLVYTSFIRAKGMLGNLSERNLRKLESINCELSGEIYIPRSAVSVLEIVLASMTKKKARIYSVEENGWAMEMGKNWRICGDVPRLERAVSKLSKFTYPDLYRLKFAFNENRTEFDFESRF